MNELPSYAALVDSFSKLPGIGAKSAERMAFAVLEMRKEDAEEFSAAITNAKRRIHKCPECGMFTEEEVCDICADPDRDPSTMIVVSYPKDALSFEKINSFKGVYHVLNGVISPSKGMGGGDLRIPELLQRIEKLSVKEVILATSPTLEGETTALFLAKILEGKVETCTRLAYGLPMGGSLDYADALTLTKALEGRKKL